MHGKLVRLKKYLSLKGTSILLFSYGIIVGTSSPLLLSHCTSDGCANCGGACIVSLGILPLLLFIAAKSRTKGAAKQITSLWHRSEGSQ